MQDGHFAKVKRIACREDGRYLIVLTVGSSDHTDAVEFVILDELFEEVAEELESGYIDEECVATIDRYADITAAFSSACASLAFCECAAKALFRKLLAKGFSRSASEAAVNIAVRRGYIDEDTLAIRRAELMVAKPWGRSRIFAKLREEGFADKAMNAVAAYLDEVDFSDGCATVIMKKYYPIPAERREREKMYASLARLGFSSADIKAAIVRVNHDE